MRNVSRYRAAAVLLCVLGALSMTIAARKEREKDPVPTGPALRLTATPRHGFRPVTVTLTGSLRGVPRTDQEFCHAGIEWEATAPGGEATTAGNARLISRSMENPRCLHPPEQVDVQMTFTKVVTLSRPGVYVYRLILHRRDGERVLSNTQEIRVIDNR